MIDVQQALSAAREALKKYWDGDEMSGIGNAVDDLLAALDAAQPVAWALPKALAETRADGFTVVREGHEHHRDGTYCVPVYLAPPAAVPEDAIEAAYWDFDARHKGYGSHKTTPQSERDAFKWAVRAMLAAAQGVKS